VAFRNEAAVLRIQQLKADHPFWGYRRVWAHLRFIDRMGINKKRVLRLLREHRLTVLPNFKPKAARGSDRPKPRPVRPNQWWGIDMTKVMTDSGWAYVVIVLDWYSKKVVGHYAGRQAAGRHWLLALDAAVNRQFPGGVRDRGLSLMSDNGSQPTSLRFLKTCSRLGVRQAFTCYNNPKGNADTERMMRTLKEELFWLFTWPSPEALAKTLNDWIKKYNQTYLHSALGYQPPNRCEETYNLSPTTPFQAA
jgi:transposase InsO family protein